MLNQEGVIKRALSQKTTSSKLLYDRQKRGGVREIIGYRFFFTLFTAFFVCLSISVPNSVGRQLEYDFKLPAASSSPSAAAAAAAAADADALPSAIGPHINVAAVRTVGKDITDGAVPEGAPQIPFGFSETDTVTIYKLKYTAPPQPQQNDKGATSYESPANPGQSESTGAGCRLANGGIGLVILDAGHGGFDPGSIEKGICEKDIALDVALATAKLLNEAGVEYILTRGGDEHVSIARRAELANSENAAFLVSVHCDWYTKKSINGTSMLYNECDGASKRLAEQLQSYITTNLGTADRGVHPHSDIALLRETNVPAVIVELAFLSNAKDLSLANSDEFKTQAAQNLAGGICAYMKSEYREQSGI